MDVKTSIILLACIIKCSICLPVQVFFPAPEKLAERDSSSVLDTLQQAGKSKTENEKSQSSEDVISKIFEINKGSHFATYEGDILKKKGRSAENCTDCHWPKIDGKVIIPYNFSYNYSDNQLALFKSAMQEYESLTCVRFVPQTTETSFLNIVSSGGCASYIGKTGGAQTVELAAYGCMYRGIIQHELNHAVGFVHEQSRSDRDNYVIINTEYITPGYLSNFVKSNTDNLGLEYDYKSVMHYPRDAFSNTTGKDTITPIPDPTVPIGQRDGLSILDISKINKLYNCDVCGNLLPYTNGTMISANYPSAYPNNANCVWLIRTPSGQVSLQFQAFDIESSPGCVSDYIKIYDGPSKTSPVLVDKACGAGLIPLQIASTNQMLVEFVSDGAFTGVGFKATYSSVQCGGAYYVSGKTFTTPGYPGNYPPNVDCTWTITAPVGYKVSLKFMDFSLESAINCMYDNLYIYNATVNVAATSPILGPFCGLRTFTSPFSSKENFLTLKFHSDVLYESKGFNATITFVKPK
ncbi:hypothetical protein GDO86_016419 [Hymenochirus boettgeri]|uniref:Metalloendopeptidase n=1 Tax=Hymenochirus boettgeri TaxID=247094 RepID=A0A8T2JX22_9PIPI|nr:hypothetical protein GDO86_016419 [Hymenochirus boettgeri]